MSLLIESMKQEHLGRVQELEKMCFGQQWTPTNFQTELENPRCFYFVGSIEKKVQSYLGYWQILEEAHITSVGVDLSLRKKKVAQQLMCHMLDDCLAKNVNWITLEVKASNIAAQKLYEKFGFKVLGRRKNYYQVDKQDALIMWTEDISSADYQHELQKIKNEILIPIK